VSTFIERRRVDRKFRLHFRIVPILYVNLRRFLMRSATLIGSSLVVLALVGVEVGCRSNNGTGGTGAGGAGTTTSTKASTGATMTTGTTGTTNPSTTASTGTAMCKSPETMPHAPGTAPYTLFCPYPATGTMMKYIDPTVDHCCEAPVGQTSTVDPLNMMCTNVGMTGYMDWGCASSADCHGGTPVCCTNGNVTISQNTVGGTPCPGDFFASKFYSTTCVASTAACKTQPDDKGGMGVGIVMCQSNADCTDAAHPTCQVFRKSGHDVGGCQ
jgi:hypothetical protein